MDTGKIPSLSLDATDLRILNTLQADAKINIKELADKLGLTKTPVYERIKALEKTGVIDKYTAVVDKSRIAPYIIVFCSVSLDVQKADYLETFKDAIAQIPEVVECYLTGGATDFLMKVIVQDLAAYHQFASGKLAVLKNVNQIKSTFVLSEIKHTTAFPLMQNTLD